ncbi:hypothetical protein [Halomonas sp. E14]|uniref:hypothetical protein n=1 Tax=Halomonas sp. E14 TaxID=3397245 RepID=UPI00403E76C5
MFEIFTDGQPENSLIYLLLASIIGGVIGASLKLVFEVVLGGKIAHQRHVENSLQQYKVPLVSASEALAARIGNLLSPQGKNWFQTSDYYYLSTLYIFCSYFGWVEIMNNKILQLRISDTKRSREMFRAFILVEKALNNNIYFRCGNYRKNNLGTGELPKLICKALGELIVVENSQGEKECLGFAEFCEKVENDKGLVRWLIYLEDFISSANDEFGNARWDRLHLVELALLVLSNVLDPKNLHSSKLPRAKAKAILSGVKEPYAREVFVADTVKWCLPIHVEPAFSTFKRKFRRVVGMSPELGCFKRYYEYPKSGVEYVFEPKNRQLESEKGRSKFYQQIRQHFKKEINNIPFGVRVNLVVRFFEDKIPDDALERIPKNIANASRKFTLPEWVSLTKIHSANL